jgi:hypothetical protein
MTDVSFDHALVTDGDEQGLLGRSAPTNRLKLPNSSRKKQDARLKTTG